MSLGILSLTALSIFQQASSLVVPRQSTGGSESPVVAGYYAGWHGTGPDAFPLSSVSWEKYNTMIYAFATTTPSVDILSLNGSDPSLLPEFVCQAHEHGVAAHISMGGWTGSQYFSSNIASAENRTAFVKTVTDFTTEYGLDGINFDWEYPNKQGVGCNTVNKDDTENFLLFLQELRKDPVGAELTLSAATQIVPFYNSSAAPSLDVSGFAEALDYIMIMGYDIWGSWSSAVGPNAPLNDTCAVPANQQGSVVSAVEAWTKANMPAEKIVLNVGAYGHSFNVLPSDAFVADSKTELASYPKFNASNQPLGDAWDDTSGDDVCGVFQGSGGTYNLWSLIQDGYLTTEGNPAPGIYYRYDDCSQTPFVYNETSEVMISFDNIQSFAAKGNYIKKQGLRGFGMWEVGGDYHDLLLDSLMAGIITD